MEVKCPNCIASLVFDAASGRMHCKFCGSFFAMADMDEWFKEEPVAQSQAQGYESTVTEEFDTIECNVYSCTSCGAELSVNGVEASTFCAYCGQPSIVFSRVSQMLKPEVIIPFRIEKQQAVEIIRKRFDKGVFIPKSIKDFELEKVRGIYIPYWLLDAYYYDRQLIRGTVGSGKSSRTKYFMRVADCQFQKLSLDASFNLDDESSQRLEPYDMRGLRQFEIGYMSGFYADRYDRNSKDLHWLAERRMKALFDEQTLDSCVARNKRIVSSKPDVTIQKETYAMLPAWFMTLRYKEKPYTMLVNGQTGKIVGAVPFDSSKVIGAAISIFLLSLIVTIPVGINISSMVASNGKVFFGIIFILAAMVVSGLKNLKKLRTSEKLTSSQRMNNYAHARQDAGGDYTW